MSPVCAYAVFKYIDADAEDCAEGFLIKSRHHGVPMVTKRFTNQSARFEKNCSKLRRPSHFSIALHSMKGRTMRA